MAMNATATNLEREIDARLMSGQIRITLGQYESKLRSIGYRLDRSMDCKAVAQYMTGERAGETYPACSMYPVQIDDGKSWAHVDARRDNNFDHLKKIRDTYFAVSRGYIHEF